VLETLADAPTYILRLKKADQYSEPWQTAAEALLMAAEGRGPIMHARIGVLRALNAGKPKTDPAPSRKRTKAVAVMLNWPINISLVGLSAAENNVEHRLEAPAHHRTIVPTATTLG
jgi:hypothetical protein